MHVRFKSAQDSSPYLFSKKVGRPKPEWTRPPGLSHSGLSPVGARVPSNYTHFKSSVMSSQNEFVDVSPLYISILQICDGEGREGERREGNKT